MADTQPKSTTATTGELDHDRVALPSVAKDGTLDQHDPEFIGDKDTTKEAVRRQFAENVVSAVDAQRLADESAAEEVGQDPAIEERQQEHEKVAKAAEKQADKLVNDLHQG